MLEFLIFLVVFLVLFLYQKVYQLEQGKIKVSNELKLMQYKKMSPLGSVNRLSVLPLMDFYADGDDLRTEAGVSYLIKADDTTILMDVGYNARQEHPSPLLGNMHKLGVEGRDIDMIFLSHLHLDHVGGAKDQKNGTFSISQGPVELPEIPVYAPDEVMPSTWNPAPKPEVVREPRLLKPGIASIGAIPRCLFLIGYILEHSLAINVAGKGIVLIVGCGHQTIERIIERAKILFDEPIYAIIGGLHFPVNGGRIMYGPLNIQHIVGSDNPPWRGLNEGDVQNAIDAIKKEKPCLVSLSPHDSSDRSIEQFKQAFGESYRDLAVGREIVI